VRKKRAFANFFKQLSALKEDRSQRLVTSYVAGRRASKKVCTPAPTTRTYKECAHRLVTLPIDGYRNSYLHHELRCTLQSAEMEKCQRSPEDIAKYGALPEHLMAWRLRVRGLLASVIPTNAKKRMEFVNRNFNAAINIRRRALKETRPPKLTRPHFLGQPLQVE